MVPTFSYVFSAMPHLRTVLDVSCRQVALPVEPLCRRQVQHNLGGADSILHSVKCSYTPFGIASSPRGRNLLRGLFYCEGTPFLVPNDGSWGVRSWRSNLFVLVAHSLTAEH